MSFMYKSVVSRGPGKRKIKLQEENILRLMQDENDADEEDDCDFEIAADKSTLSESESDESNSSSESSKSTSDEETEPQQVNHLEEHRSSSSRRHRHKYDNIIPTLPGTGGFLPSHNRVQSSLSETQEKIAKQWESLRQNVLKGLDKPALVCCICLKSQHHSKMLVCSQCGIAVHQGCCHEKSSDVKKLWFCSSCLSKKPKDCDLCPSQDGCLQETSSRQWCHVICARYILGTNMFNESNLIDFSTLNVKLYGSKDCILCEDVVMSKTGICIKCDAGLCKSFFHVTCAQKYGLLSENDNNVDSETDPYFVYCPLHVTKESMVQSQKLYITTFESVQLRVNSQTNGNQNHKVLFSQAAEHRQLVESNFSPPTILRGHPPQRYLSSNAAAMRMFSKKAEKALNIDIRSPSVYFPRPSDVRKRHHVVPALTPEFASHFADRELRILEYSEHLRQSSEENRHFLNLESEYRNKYQQLQEKLEGLKTKEQETLKTSQNLFSHFISLKQWAVENQKNKSGDLVKLKLKREVLVKDAKSPPRKRPSQDVIKSRSPKISKPLSLLKSCDICHGDDNQHMLIDCGVCMKWFHLNCLDPPLLQMPRKSKFSLWQCSKCAPSSDSDSDDISRGSLVTAEGRRVTRRSHRPPDKLVAVSDTDIVQQQRMISYFSRSIKKSNLKKQIIMKKRLKKKKQVIKKTLLESQNQKSPTKPGESPPGTSPAKSLIIPLGRDFSPTVKLELVEVEKKQAENLKANHIVPVSSQLMSKTDLLAALGKLMPSTNIQSAAATSSLVRLQGDFFQKNNIAIRKPIILPSHKIFKADGVKPIQTASVAAIVRTTAEDSRDGSVQTTTMASNPPTNDAAPICKVCESGKSSDKMLLCMKCSKYFHIWCCDPPFKSMPRTNRFCQWECSDCCVEADEGEDVEMDEEGAGGGMEQTPDGRKRITRRRKPPEKFSHLFDMSLQRRLENSRRRRLSRNKKRLSRGSPRTDVTKRETRRPSSSSSSDDDDDDVVNLTNDEKVAMTTSTPNDKVVTSTGGIFHMKLAVEQPRTEVPEEKPAAHDVSKTSLPSIIRLYSQLSKSEGNQAATYKVKYDSGSFNRGARTLTTIKQLLKTQNRLKSKEIKTSASTTARIKTLSRKTSEKRSKTAHPVSDKNSAKKTLDVPPNSHNDVTAPPSVTTKPALFVEHKETLPSSEKCELLSGTPRNITSIAASQIVPYSDKTTTALPSVDSTFCIKPAPATSEATDENQHKLAKVFTPSDVTLPDHCYVTTSCMTPGSETNSTRVITSDEQSSTVVASSEIILTAGHVAVSADNTNNVNVTCDTTPPSEACESLEGATITDTTTVPQSGESTAVLMVEDVELPPGNVTNEKVESTEECKTLTTSGDDIVKVTCDITIKKSELVTIAPSSGQIRTATSTVHYTTAPSDGKKATMSSTGSTLLCPETNIVQSSDSSKTLSTVLGAGIVSDDRTVPPSDSVDTPAENVSGEKCETIPSKGHETTGGDKFTSDLTRKEQSEAELPTSKQTTCAEVNFKVANKEWPISLSTHSHRTKAKESPQEVRKIVPRIAAKQPEKILTGFSQTVKLAAGSVNKVLAKTVFPPVVPPSGKSQLYSPIEQPHNHESLKEIESIVKKLPPASDSMVSKRVTLVLPRPIGTPALKTTEATSSNRLVSINAVKRISVPIVLKRSPTTENSPS